jgi:hypothetical protein
MPNVSRWARLLTLANVILTALNFAALFHASASNVEPFPFQMLALESGGPLAVVGIAVSMLRPRQLRLIATNGALVLVYLLFWAGVMSHYGVL